MYYLRLQGTLNYFSKTEETSVFFSEEARILLINKTTVTLLCDMRSRTVWQNKDDLFLAG